MNQSSEVVVLLGAGAIGLEIVRRLATKNPAPGRYPSKQPGFC